MNRKNKIDYGGLLFLVVYGGSAFVAISLFYTLFKLLM